MVKCLRPADIPGHRRRPSRRNLNRLPKLARVQDEYSTPLGTLRKIAASVGIPRGMRVLEPCHGHGAIVENLEKLDYEINSFDGEN